MKLRRGKVEDCWEKSRILFLIVRRGKGEVALDKGIWGEKASHGSGELIDTRTETLQGILLTRREDYSVKSAGKES